ncbi:hypothetical protein FNF27_06662 [Cafeteria roenbergensis]|uniref:Cytosolic fatty-acid binding proteins domain-containing protein n=1 Tax=Cafeteria roenbergensis TaxID=33653 RepID=A0A5A8DYG3_CAFRO|nr:hypothetical protein FNF29_07358 [Cafeteria roenbergensis]KAA0158088.1 hypothetical protein FNF31_05591 [Cafeteria roenbergensis]KAA0163326.1 hypothetical protein FNF28_04246 [Cafeteria roenbergensis]KAA0170229.1 hypothetical protein FNF27_06662 [Cafeteria roenbergensis]|eukprot:KAA0147413.1 hypothetical protein FNF29_07358 [Cafeteria roenbergensis]
MAASASSIDITKYTGKWKPNVSKSDDFEPFLAEAGVPWLVRKAIKRSAPITELAVTGTTFRAVVNSGSGKANEGTFGEEIDWHTPGGTSKVKLELSAEGAISMTGPSPNAKDPKGTLVTTYTLLPDGTLQLTMHISRGDGSELLIRRILERAD